MTYETIKTKSIEELSEIVEILQAEVDDIRFGGIDVASDDYLELATKYYTLAELKKELAIKELIECGIDNEVVNAIKSKEIDLKYEMAINNYEEMCYRWALAQVEKASPNSLVSYVPEELITELFIKLLSMNVILTVKEGSTFSKQNIKSLMLQRSTKNVEIKNQLAALETQMEIFSVKTHKHARK